MQPDLHSRFASERLKDDHAGLQTEDDGTAALEPESITIRPLQSGDEPAVGAACAELEERPVPRGPLVLAGVEGSIEAAIGVEEPRDGREPVLGQRRCGLAPARPRRATARGLESGP